MTTSRLKAAISSIFLILPFTARIGCCQQVPHSEFRPTASSETSPSAVLSPSEWQKVDRAVARALEWLASQQLTDGSFSTLDMGQPGVTCLCILGFMAHGHRPSEGRYGELLSRAIDYTMLNQKRCGLIARLAPDTPILTRNIVPEIGVPVSYNHAIGSLMLSEAYGMTRGQQTKRVESAIERALAVSIEMQRWPRLPKDNGGWRYVHQSNGSDSDLSVTGWELMFLRSARNAGFAVPKQSIDDAVNYVRGCFSRADGAFVYLREPGEYRSRGMAGAGILALAHAGYHHSVEAERAGDWLLQHGFEHYNQIAIGRSPEPLDRYHYGLFNACYGMYQLGGRHWEQFFPKTVECLLANQNPDGSWDADSHFSDGQFGATYTTALVVLSLGAANQFLPVFQR